MNGGTAVNGEGWGQNLQRESTNMHTVAAFCSWWAMGGSISNVLPRRSYQELNLTGSWSNTYDVRSAFTLFTSSLSGVLSMYIFSRCSRSSRTSILILPGAVENTPLKLDSDGLMVSSCGSQTYMEAFWTLQSARISQPTPSRVRVISIAVKAVALQVLFPRPFTLSSR